MQVKPPIVAGLPPVPVPGASASAFLSLCIALLIVGAVTEGLYRVSPGAAYTLVLIVILGYFSMGGRRENVVQFFNSLGITKGG